MSTPTSSFVKTFSTVSKSLVLLVVPFVAIFFCSGLCKADEWPGWRGLDRCGRQTNGAGPEHWTATRNVIWKTPIRGRGYSSPVISGECLFVTSAYLSDRSFKLQQALGLLTYGLTMLLGVEALRCLIATCRATSTGGVVGPPLLSLTGLTLLILAIVTSILFSGNVFKYAQCPIRSWIGSSVTVSAILLLVGVKSGRGSPVRGVLGTLLLLFAILVLAGTPVKDHVFRNGVLDNPGVVILATAGVPLFFGLFLLWGYFRARAKQPVFVNTGRWNSSIVIGLGVLLTCMLMSLIALVTYKVVIKGSFSEEYPQHPTYSPLIAAGTLVLCTSIVFFLVASCVYTWFRGRTIRGHMTAACSNGLFLARLTQVLGGTAAALTAGILLANWAIGVSEFLIYNLQAPNWTPTLGLPYAITMACVGGGVLVSFIVTQVVLKRPSMCEMSRWTVPAGLLLAGVLFVDTNFIASDEVFVRSIICVNRRSGEVQWEWKGLEGPKQQVHVRNGQATPTAMVDDKHIYAYFGSRRLVCIDYDGQTVWTCRDIDYESINGVGASPVAHNGVLVVVNDMPGAPYVRAFDCTDGSVLWNESRLAEKDGRKSGGHSRTPLIVSVNERDTVLVWGWGVLTGYDLYTGEECFRYRVQDGGDCVASITADDAKLYFGSPQGLVAFGLADLGCEDAPIVWECRANVNCVTPVVNEGRLYAILDSGILVCVDTKTGRRLWRKRLPGEYRASPVAVGNLVYFCNIDGVTTVIRDKPQFEQIAHNELGESVAASFAVADDCLFVRTEKHLFCLGEQR